MEKTAVLSDLPHGSGAALGAFIRSLFLTASNKYSIIGIGVNGQGAFDKIGNNTTLVTDVVLNGISFLKRLQRWQECVGHLHLEMCMNFQFR